jgi:hypothetical protein
VISGRDVISLQLFFASLTQHISMISKFLCPEASLASDLCKGGFKLAIYVYFTLITIIRPYTPTTPTW